MAPRLLVGNVHFEMEELLRNRIMCNCLPGFLLTYVGKIIIKEFKASRTSSCLFLPGKDVSIHERKSWSNYSRYE